MNPDPPQILSSYADRIVRTVLDTLGEACVDSIFVAGSVARGSIAACVVDGMTEVYSDLDVYVIVTETVDLGESRRQVRDAVRNLPRLGDGYRILPRPDVGVFTRNVFVNQKTRPGTVEISDGNVVLYGQRDAIEWSRKFTAEAIEPSEGLYLLENRFCDIAEMTHRLRDDTSGPSLRYFRYVLMKSCVDAVSSLLIVSGRFTPAREERLRRFRERSFLSESSALLPTGSVAVIEQCAAGLENLQETLEEGGGEFDADRRDVESILLDVWRRIAERLGSRGPMSWDEAVLWRCKRGCRYRNLREVLALAKGMSVSRVTLLPGLGRLARLSPTDALRLHGAVEILLTRGEGRVVDMDVLKKALEQGYLGVLDGLTRAFGFENGTLYERSRRMFKHTT